MAHRTVRLLLLTLCVLAITAVIHSEEISLGAKNAITSPVLAQSTQHKPPFDSYPNVVINDGVLCPLCEIGQSCCVHKMNASMYTCMEGEWDQGLCCFDGSVCDGSRCLYIQAYGLNRTIECCDLIIINETHLTTNLCEGRCIYQDGLDLCEWRAGQAKPIQYITFGALFALQVVNLFLLYFRRRYNPLRARNTRVLLISWIASVVLAFGICIGASTIPCPLSMLLVMLSAPVVFTAFITRVTYVYFLHKYDTHKARALSAYAETAPEQPQTMIGRGITDSQYFELVTDDRKLLSASLVAFRRYKFLLSSNFHILCFSVTAAVSFISYSIIMGVYSEPIPGHRFLWKLEGCLVSPTAIIVLGTIIICQSIILGIFGVLIRKIEDAFGLSREIVVDIIVSVSCIGVIIVHTFSPPIFTFLAPWINDAGFWVGPMLMVLQFNNTTLPAIRTYFWRYHYEEPLSDFEDINEDDLDFENELAAEGEGSSRTMSASEISSRINSVDKVLKNAIAMRHFKKYMEKEFSSENGIVWEAITDYKKLFGDGVNNDDAAVIGKRRKIAVSIYDAFIRNGAEVELNVSPATRQKIGARINSLEEDLFRELEQEVLGLLRDTFSRFLQSPLWNTMLDELHKKGYDERS